MLKENIMVWVIQEFMMNEDWTEGFKEGFKIGLEEGKRHQNLNPVPSLPSYQPLDMTKGKCPKCGITIGGMMGYVCSSVNCPTFYQTTSHGSAAPDNSVWINGEWASLGS
jgi:hypothetical protein